MSADRRRLRVLVVEDSAVTRQVLGAILTAAGEFELLETVADGRRAVERVAALAPDVVTMDIHLPGIDGIEATRRIVRRRPTPVLVVSASSNINGETVYDALQAGAVGVVLRPMPRGHPDYEKRRRDFLHELRSAARVDVGTQAVRPATTAAAEPPVGAIRPRAPIDIIGFAASTGGPSAVRRILSDLRGETLPPVVVVQHMSPGFLPGYAEWLAQAADRRVLVAQAGSRAKPNEVVIAPDDRHMTVASDGRIRLRSGAPLNGHRPAADALFTSLAEAYGPRAMGVILTGMGNDGAHGLLKLREAGGVTLGQDRESSVVYGMPAAAAKARAVERDVGLAGMAQTIRMVMASASRDREPTQELGPEARKRT